MHGVALRLKGSDSPRCTGGTGDGGARAVLIPLADPPPHTEHCIAGTAQVS